MERLERSGVPVLWRDGPEPAMAALVFRVGMADEPLPLRGISHMLEHLTMFTAGERKHEVNAFVELLRTVFWARGSQDELTTWIGDVVRALRSPRLDRLELERRVLRTEGEGGADPLVERALFLRCGYGGPGVTWAGELALDWAGAAELERWRDERFTAGNAALWWHGPSPPELELELPPGSAPPPPAPRLQPRLEVPCWVESGSGGVLATLVAERSYALTAGLSLASGRLHDRLRLERALSYSTGGGYDILGRDHPHATSGADCLDEHAGEVAATLVDVLEDLAATPPPADELDEWREAVAAAEAEGYERERTRDLLDRGSLDLLLGAPLATAGELGRERAAITPDEISRALGRALDSAMVLAPAGTPKPRASLSNFDVSVGTPVAGRSFRAGRLRRKVRVIVGPDGISHLGGEDGVVTLPRDEWVVALRAPARGSLTLVSRSGASIELDPRGWRDGDALISAVDELVPPELVAILDEGVAGDVEALAAEQIHRRWMVEDEVAALPEALRPGERLVRLARASRGMQAGLLAVTDRRIVFLYKGIRKDSLVEVDLAKVLRATSKDGLTSGAVTVVYEEGTVAFTDVIPAEAAKLVADDVMLRRGVR